ncbi:heavy-metal-associated domain-containing protein [Pseudanabaena sp. FACHB-2040]|uniref:heavy-metal-associated domain-containing protein n=1 Tax=Pseudanabaena sp. FACHB-2040 TaxID=2692859 RepID=UPI001681DB1F|nr:heavy-metal-associated domain-containing protein [Pseudanabaena sp. FACHB-2040]MBD2259617.1 heavy-metal-associated domain-containing protein [Pseudanabaena sp. FACHB-2040]
MTTLNLTVPDMACGACVDTITQAVKSLDADAAIAADTKTKAVNITTSADANTVTQAITDAGYTVNA